MDKLKRCSRCITPETHETIVFDENGVCNICLQQDFKKEVIDWIAKKEELDKLIEKYRGKYVYDCIIPFSGGKDSTDIGSPTCTLLPCPVLGEGYNLSYYQTSN